MEILFNLFFRFYHFGIDKPDNVDEIGQPINEEFAEESLVFNYQQQHDQEYADEVSSEKNSNELESLTQNPVEIIEQEDVKDMLPDEGTDPKVVKDIFPQILQEPEIDDPNENPVKYLKRSDSALNIFDQTTILKLFSAKNWTETFFNRIFRKKFLVISPGAEALSAFKNGLDLEQQMMHLSQNYPRDFLPAIASSERDKKLTNDGLLLSLPTPSHAA